MKQVIIELFVLLLTILLFLIGMTQFNQPSKSKSHQNLIIHQNVYTKNFREKNTRYISI